MIDYSTWNRPTDAEIEGIQKVNQTTGYENDNFTDDEVLKIVLDRSEFAGQCDVTVWILSEVHPRFRHDPEKRYVVQIVFYEVENVEIADFNHQNVISAFLVKQQEDQKLGILIGSKFGGDITML